MKFSNSKYILSIAFCSVAFIVFLITVCFIAKIPEEKKVTSLFIVAVIIFICTINLITMKITDIEIENNIFYITKKPMYGYFPILNYCEVIPFTIIKELKYNERLGYISILFSVYQKNIKYEYAKYSFLHGLASEKIIEIVKIYNLRSVPTENILKNY